MKKFFLLCMICFLTLSAQTQNVGIGTTTPVQKLHVEGTTYLNGNVGIGTTTPAFPLSFGPALGDKISLWSNSSNSYGFGIQGGLLQIHTDISAADIAFGYGSSAAFTEKMRIKGDGNVGIGISTPTASLEVMRGTGAGGTAVFRGTTHTSHFNYNTDEDTYIRAGKDNRNVIINDIPGGKVGIGTSSPNASALLDVSSTTKGFLPPRMTSAQRDAITTPEEGLMIYNTTTKKPNYYNGTEWRDFDGGFIPQIGDNYQGGKIAYILQPGDPGFIAGQTHGLIAAASDQSAGAEWGCYGTAIPGADGTALGTGNQNTIDIIAGCATAGIAARLCGDLVLNGYSDWYLPSKDELNKLFINREAVGGFNIVVTSYYWSSSESDANGAFSQNFYYGSQGPDGKYAAYRVRAVRAF